MPNYEYTCKDCRASFEKTLTLVAQQGFTTFYPVTSKKSA